MLLANRESLYFSATVAVKIKETDSFTTSPWLHTPIYARAHYLAYLKNIKIKNDCLYVNNQLHGRTVNQTFQIDSSSPSGFCTTEMSDVETTPKNLLIVQEHSTSATATFLTPPQNNDCTPTQAPHSIQQSESPPVAPRRKDPQVSNNQPKL